MREDLYQLYLNLKTENNIEFLNKINTLSCTQITDLESRYPEIFDRVHNLMAQEIYHKFFNKKTIEEQKQDEINRVIDIARRLNTPEKIQKEMENVIQQTEEQIQEVLKNKDVDNEKGIAWFRRGEKTALKFLTDQLNRLTKKGDSL